MILLLTVSHIPAYPASLAAQSDIHSQSTEHEHDPFADPAVAGPSGAGTAAAAGGVGAAAGAGAAGAGAPAAAPKKFYKKPWFILTLIVGQILGLVLLFLLLWPLVHGIADVSPCNICTTTPSNTPATRL